jgi:hypothetical protein
MNAWEAQYRGRLVAGQHPRGCFHPKNFCEPYNEASGSRSRPPLGVGVGIAVSGRRTRPGHCLRPFSDLPDMGRFPFARAVAGALPFAKDIKGASGAKKFEFPNLFIVSFLQEGWGKWDCDARLVPGLAAPCSPATMRMRYAIPG